MRKIKLIGLGVALALLSPHAVSAQTPVVPGTLLAPAAPGQQQQFQMWPVDSSGYLKVDVAAGGGSGGTSQKDQSAFTQGATAITPIGCLYISSYAAITTGEAGVASCTSGGALNVNIVGGAAVGIAQGATYSAQTFQPVMGLASTNAPTATTGDLWALSISPASGGVRIDLKDTASNTNPFLVAGAGTAGSASGGILTVQGVASMTPILATVSQATSSSLKGQFDPLTIATWGLMSGTVPGTAPTNTAIVGAIYNSSAPTATTGQTLPLQTDASGNLLVNIKAGGGTGGTSLADQAAFTQTSTAITPIGCLYIGSYASITTGHAGVVSCTAAGSMHTTVDNVNSNITPGDTISTATYAGASPTIGVALLWNGTTYDRQKSVSTGVASVGVASGGIASGAIASGAIASGAIASGAIASGAVASGAFASGAFAAGSFVNATAGDPCMFAGKKTASFSTGTSGTQLIAGTGSTNTYICSLAVIASAAANFSLVVGSGSSVCTGGTPLAIYGGTTTASAGMLLAANGGLTAGNGGGTIASDLAAAAQGYNVCIGINGTSTLAGTITYIQR